MLFWKHALFSGQYTGACRNCGQNGHNAAQCKTKHVNHVGKSGNCLILANVQWYTGIVL
jgi:Zinc knuckle